MRFVERTAIVVPTSLSDVEGPWAKEYAKATDYYSNHGNKSYKFKAYKSADVKEALELLFHGKCAYCECSYAAICPVDVEHYRPKSSVEQEPGHPGYWWLAGVWENLLPSCIDCNRRRRQKVFVLAEEGLSLPYVHSGKKDSFPIRGKRAIERGDNLDEEDPLLINPCVVDPREHMSWHIEDEMVIVLPVVDNVVSLYGKESIAAYGLNRQKLVEARVAVMSTLQLYRLNAEEWIEQASGQDGARRNRSLGSAKRLLDKLAEACHPSKPFSAMARAFLDETLDGLINRYTELSQN